MVSRKIYRIIFGIILVCLYIYLSFHYSLKGLDLDNKMLDSHLNCLDKYNITDYQYNHENSPEINICRQIENEYKQKNYKIQNIIDILGLPFKPIVFIFTEPIVAGIIPNFGAGFFIIILNSIFYFYIGYIITWLIHKFLFKNEKSTK